MTPPQLLAFTHGLADALRPHGIKLVGHDGYVNRSDDVSMLQFTPNISLLGYADAYPHFNQTPYSNVDDLVQLTKVLVLVALAAQDSAWQARYL